MKKLLGIVVALILVAACTTALALGTYAVGTKTEPLSAKEAAQMLELLKKSGELKEADAQGNKVDSAAKNNAVYTSASVMPPKEVHATSVNNQVNLSWEKDGNANYWCVYEKTSSGFKGLKVLANALCTLDNVKDGKHTYGVCSIYYDSAAGDIYYSESLTVVTVDVLNGSDKPGAGADIQEINISGTRDRSMKMTVYDNTYLHIKTDSLTWFISSANSAIVTPSSENGIWFTSLGQDLYVKATRHKPSLTVCTLTYEKQVQDGKTLYRPLEIKATYVINMTYVKGNAPVESKGLIYQLDEKKGVATVTGASNKNATKIAVPDKVKVNGKSYKVTKIAANAFKGMKKVKTATIGKNVKEIGKNAFNGCKALKTVTIKSTLLTKSSVKSGAFKGIDAKATVKCPKKKLKDYKKFLPGKGVPKTATIK